MPRYMEIANNVENGVNGGGGVFWKRKKEAKKKKLDLAGNVMIKTRYRSTPRRLSTVKTLQVCPIAGYLWKARGSSWLQGALDRERESI